MSDLGRRAAGVTILISAIFPAPGLHAGPTTSNTTTQDTPEDYSAMAAAHIGRLRMRLSEIDDSLGESSREIHDRLLIEKMSTLFELLTLEARSLEPLDRLASEARAHQPREALAEAADYWRLRIALCRTDPKTGFPFPASAGLKQVEQYLVAHPHSPYAALLIDEVIESAYASRELAIVDRLLDRLRKDFPDHPTTSALVGGDRLRRMIGEPWGPALTDAHGAAVDWSSMRERPVVVLFCASWDVASQQALRAIATWPAFRERERPSLIVISLDRNAADAEGAMAKAGLAAIVCCDGRGWASVPAVEWGIRRLPVALVLDGSGHLREVVRGVGSDFDKHLRAAWKAVGGRLE